MKNYGSARHSSMTTCLALINAVEFPAM